MARSGGVVWFKPELRVTYRPRASVRPLAAQYFHYGRWRRVVARQHARTMSPRYLAPPAAVLAMALGALAGIAGLAGLLSGATGIWPAPLACAFALPALYPAGVTAVAVMAARRLRFSVAARVPVVLATMRIFWGIGFITSPRSLTPGNREAARAGSSG